MRMTFVLALCLLLVGCATSGYKTEIGQSSLTKENVNTIIGGETTKDEIVKLFGEPISKTQSSILGEMWTYSYSTNKVTGTGFFSWNGPKQDIYSCSLVVIFDAKNIVKDFTFTEINPMQQYKMTVF